jgi:chemotaxis protein methyltransferase WspC
VPDSVEGYYLKGLILLGFDMDVEAMDAFKKALYLDPKHYQSLIHLSVLSEEQGEIRAAENFRARADRLRESGQLDEI